MPPWLRSEPASRRRRCIRRSDRRRCRSPWLRPSVWPSPPARRAWEDRVTPAPRGSPAAPVAFPLGRYPMTIKSVLIAGSLSGAICAAGAGYLGYHLTAKMKDGEIAALRLSYAQAEKAAIIKAAALQKSQDDAGTRIALAAAAAHERIVTRTVTTVKEVPIYVTRETDARFPLPCGFVRASVSRVT